MKWLLWSFVGKTVSLDGAFSVQRELDCVGWSSIKATPLSGNIVLLTGENQDSVKEFLTQEASLLSNWFEELKNWDSLFAVKGRRFQLLASLHTLGRRKFSKIWSAWLELLWV